MSGLYPEVNFLISGAWSGSAPAYPILPLKRTSVGGSGNEFKGSWTDQDGSGTEYSWHSTDPGNSNKHYFANNALNEFIVIEYDTANTTTISSTDYYHIIKVGKVENSVETLVVDGDYNDDNFNLINEFNNVGSVVPCLTETCNILTPNGYQNVSSLKVGDMVTTSDNRNVAIEKIFHSTVSSFKVTPRLIKAHQYGKNIPTIDTHLSDLHAYQINGIWKLPKNENLPKEWISNTVTYYHVKLPNYTEDFLVVNGLITEGWDGLNPKETRPYKWVKRGKGLVLKKLKKKI